MHDRVSSVSTLETPRCSQPIDAPLFTVYNRLGVVDPTAADVLASYFSCLAWMYGAPDNSSSLQASRREKVGSQPRRLVDTLIRRQKRPQALTRNSIPTFRVQLNPSGEFCRSSNHMQACLETPVLAPAEFHIAVSSACHWCRQIQFQDPAWSTFVEGSMAKSPTRATFANLAGDGLPCSVCPG